MTCGSVVPRYTHLLPTQADGGSVGPKSSCTGRVDGRGPSLACRGGCAGHVAGPEQGASHTAAGPVYSLTTVPPASVSGH